MAKVNKIWACSALCSTLLASTAGAAEINMNTAKMQAMDKITGRVSMIDVPVNGEVKFGSFSIVVRACKATPPEETPENYAFVDVADTAQDGRQVNVFKGWMLSSTPALNAVEHPIYDVWLLKCQNGEVDKSKLLSEVALKDREGLPKAKDLMPEENITAAEPAPAEKQEPESEIQKSDTDKLAEEVIAATVPVPMAEMPATEVVPQIPGALSEAEEGVPTSLLNIPAEPQKSEETKPAEVPAAETAAPVEDKVPAEEVQTAPVVTEAAKDEAQTPAQLLMQESAPLKSESDIIPATTESLPIVEIQENTETTGEIEIPEENGMAEEEQFIDLSSEATAEDSDIGAELSVDALKP